MSSNDVIINYNSVYFNNRFFKKRERKNILILKFKTYLKFITSPHNNVLTYKINYTKRLILYRNIVKKIIETVLNKYQCHDILSNEITKFVGPIEPLDFSMMKD